MYSESPDYCVIYRSADSCRPTPSNSTVNHQDSALLYIHDIHLPLWQKTLQWAKCTTFATTKPKYVIKFSSCFSRVLRLTHDFLHFLSDELHHEINISINRKQNNIKYSNTLEKTFINSPKLPKHNMCQKNKKVSRTEKLKKTKRF